MMSFAQPVRAALRLLPLVAATCGMLGAAEVHVATTGSDGNPGSASAPLRTIQRAVDRALPGDTVFIHGGTYREGFTVSRRGTAAAPITIAAYGSDKPVIKGSQSVTGWTLHSGTTWKRTGWTANSQQVFANGVLLKQIGAPPVGYPAYFYKPTGSGVADMTPGSFYYGSGTLYVRLADGSNPNSAAMEASTLQRVAYVTGAGGYVYLKGLSFRHSNSTAYAQIAAELLWRNDRPLR